MASAGRKLVRGILDALSEEGQAAAKAASKGIKSSEGLSMKPHTPAVEGFTLSTNPPLERMFHGTSSVKNFSRPKTNALDIDPGLHLTPYPEIGGYYALSLPTERQNSVPGMSLAGPRILPMLVDPGRKFNFSTDAGNWANPKRVADMGLSYAEKSPLELGPDFDKAMLDMTKGKSVENTMKDLGYDSVVYPHHNPLSHAGEKGINLSLPSHAPSTMEGFKKYNTNPRVPEGAIMLFDEKRAVPEFSDTGQLGKQARGVLDRGRLYDRYHLLNADDLTALHSRDEYIQNPDEYLWSLMDENLADKYIYLHSEQGVVDDVEGYYTAAEKREAAANVEAVKRAIAKRQKEFLSNGNR